ncbi:MAG: DUF2256 domain-containing protein [Pirellulales bacterium]
MATRTRHPGRDSSSSFTEVSRSQDIFMKEHHQIHEKICWACGKPFRWRKKWKRCWEQVRYCSDRCRTQRKTKKGSVCNR